MATEPELISGSYVFMVPVVVEIEDGSVVAVTVIDETTPDATNAKLNDDTATGDPAVDTALLNELLATSLNGQSWPSWEFGF